MYFNVMFWFPSGTCILHFFLYREEQKTMEQRLSDLQSKVIVGGVNLVSVCACVNVWVRVWTCGCVYERVGGCMRACAHCAGVYMCACLGLCTNTERVIMVNKTGIVIP